MGESKEGLASSYTVHSCPAGHYPTSSSSVQINPSYRFIQNIYILYNIPRDNRHPSIDTSRWLQIPIPDPSLMVGCSSTSSLHTLRVIGTGLGVCIMYGAYVSEDQETRRRLRPLACAL